MLKKDMILLIGLLVCVKTCYSLDNGLALTPPMGWMHWQRYRCIVDCKEYPDDCVSEQLFKKAADLIVSEGYDQLGYEYIIVDDCWLNKTRDENGRLQPDKDRFPSGMKALADYIHGKGLKFGLYEDFGTKTCAGYPGVLGHLEQDAQQFADWDVDYVKLDGCYSNITEMYDGYTQFGKYLNETGRPMVYSCSWPAYTEPLGIPGDYETLSEYCNLWRNWDDIDDNWANVSRIIDFFAENQDRFIPYAGPGHWNDPDMLIIGNFGLSDDQSELQMAIWAIMAAPLIMSNNLATVKPQHKAILQNKDVIAVNQDALGIQGRLVFKKNKLEIWTRPILPIVNNHTSYAIAFISQRFDGRPYHLNTTLQEIGLNNPNGYTFKDLYNPDKYDSSEVYKAIKVTLFPTAVVFIKATPVDNEQVPNEKLIEVKHIF
ncbi:alpha-N-acetylgalactosaminidase [Chrysoperla carnea]|uniref:alpha-N-acetylgalactosaminidase n=1 Tax=Chrysoperla carnea TaxID=189513 RepID=UPI001D06711B|nr:alpha-N-acetylgalactosaminidase [Chrysoperla carnea]XP_044737418.1 alpha-N-acetylgalactosaminidase [Chrysoperla carnea]